MTNLKWACALVGTERWECEELFDTKEEAMAVKQAKRYSPRGTFIFEC